MDSQRIIEILGKTDHPDNISVKDALMQVWSECEREKKSQILNNFVCRKCSALSNIKLPKPEYCKNECGFN